MKRLFLALSLCIVSFAVSAQKKSAPPVVPKETVKPADSLISISATKPQIEQISKIVIDAAVLISKSNAPMNEAGPLIQNLQAVAAFLKQQSEIKPPKK